MNIILTGMPYAGKTTLGKELASQLSWRFLDTDELLERKEGIPCAEIIKTRGEPAFRALEKQLAASLEKLDTCVIATGGGFMLQPETAAPLLHNGLCVYIKRQPAAGDFSPQRPLASNEKAFLELEAKRETFYRAVAKIIFINKGTPEQAAGQLVALLREKNMLG